MTKIVITSLQKWREDILPGLNHTISEHLFNGKPPLTLYLIENDNQDCKKCCETLSSSEKAERLAYFDALDYGSPG